MRIQSQNLSGDLFGGLSSMLVAFPSAIAFGMIIYSPLGQGFLANAAIAGMIGTIVIGLIAPLAGGTNRLISAPCAPAAAVLAAFVTEVSGSTPADIIPSLILLIAVLTGILQGMIGALGIGRFVKYIPYPVVAGYLSAVGVLIIGGQISKFLGTGSGLSMIQALLAPDCWLLKGVVVGAVSMVAMLLAMRFVKKIPATIITLVCGISTYWILSWFYPEMKNLSGNKLVIGPIGGGLESVLGSLSTVWQGLFSVNLALAGKIIVTAATLAVLLSIDTLKTCLVVDALTRNRHNSNRELLGQGISNIASGLSCGIPGAGTMGATLVNLSSGAKTKLSGFFEGAFSLAALLALSSLIAWVPIAGLAAILMVIGFRMVDFKTFSLVRNKSTVFDFVVYLMVVLTAIAFNLIAAAGVGILLSIFLFLRNEARQSVIRRKAFGGQIFSKKRRTPEEIALLTQKGSEAMIVELQGPLFFGTADQLLSELEPYLNKIKYLILDMRRVHSMDYTAVHRLHQIQESLADRDGVLIMTSVPIYLPTGQNVQEYLMNLGFVPSEKNIRFFNNMNEGLQWAEDETLKKANVLKSGEGRLLRLCEIPIFSEMEPSMIEELSPCISEKHYCPGEVIFSAGEDGNEIYFIRQGIVQIFLPISSGKTEHLTTFGQGDYFGDMSFLTHEKRSANAVTEDDVFIFAMARTEFDRISQKDHLLSEKFFVRLSVDLTERLRQNHITLKTLAE